MKNISKLVLAGVREQVNLPIRLCLENKIFEKYSIDVEFKIIPEGTGKMIELVQTGEVDLAMCVADGFIAGRAKGKDISLAGVFVQSPLRWAILTSGNSKHDSFQDFIERSQCKFGISRLGSGSQTMAYYLSNNKLSNLTFTVANNFDGLIEGVNRGEFDAFLWESFTSQPRVDSGHLKKIGDILTPWPAFCLVTKGPHSLPSHLPSLRSTLFPALNEGVRLFLSDPERAVHRIVSEFGHTPHDARTWLDSCRYGDPLLSVSRAQWEDSVRVMGQCGLVPPSFLPSSLWTDLHPSSHLPVFNPYLTLV